MPSNPAVLALLAATACASAPALAAESGFYLGGGGGQSTIKDDSSSINFDENATAWKAFAGYRFGGLIPLLDFAGELTYRDFGNPSKGNSDFDAKGYDASGLAILTLGPFDLFARLGYGRYSIDTTINGVNRDKDSNSEIYGVGAGFRIGPVNIRLEWEHTEPDLVDHIDMYTINAYWRF
jgi:hypothetical protein